jgi:hypothetical protein
MMETHNSHFTKTDTEVCAHWAKHLRFVEENHPTASWLNYINEREKWLDLFAAESECPAKCLWTIKRHWPTFEPTRYLYDAIAEDKAEKLAAAKKVA